MESQVARCRCQSSKTSNFALFGCRGLLGVYLFADGGSDAELWLPSLHHLLTLFLHVLDLTTIWTQSAVSASAYIPNLCRNILNLTGEKGFPLHRPPFKAAPFVCPMDS